MSWTKKVTHPSEVVKKGDAVRAVVLSVDKEKKRIALGVKQLTPDAWLEEIPNKFHLGDLLSGYVTKTTSFGAFVKMDEDLEGLLHISELADHKIESPEEVLTAGMKVEVRVIRVDVEERKIGLSFVHAEFDENAKFLGEDGKPLVTQSDEDEEGGAGEDPGEGEEAPADDTASAEASAPEDAEDSEEAPAEEAPAEDAPAEEAPAEEAPAEEAPEEEAPAEEAPAEEAPAEEAPAEEAPEEEAPEEEAPAEEESAPTEEASDDAPAEEEVPESAEEAAGDDSGEASPDEDASEEEKKDDAG